MSISMSDPQQDPLSSSNGRSFFETERLRLIQDISKGLESTFENSNTLNRKLDESIAVGKEFHPISKLWSNFERIMLQSGVPNFYSPANATTANNSSSSNNNKEESIKGSKDSGAVGGDDGEKSEAQKKGVDAGADALNPHTSLPPGVAPGGGKIYAA